MKNTKHLKSQDGNKNERGSVAVEFALILPILASLAFGAVDFGRMLWFQEVLVNATRVGARQGTLFPGDKTEAEIKAVIATSLQEGGLDASGLSVNVSGVGSPQGQPLNVVSTVPWDFIVIDKLVPGLMNDSLRASVTMMME